MTTARPPWIERLAMKLPGRAGPHQGDYRLAQRNVFILPSRAGLLYGLVLLAMLVASINYALSLGFMLTFLLGAVAIVAMLHTFRNLSALRLHAGRAEPVFAGGMAELHLTLGESRGTDRWAIRMRTGSATTPEVVDVGARSEQAVRLSWPAPVRGLMPLPRIRVWTEYPLGLFHAWAWWHPAGQVLVYPSPESPAPPLPASRLADREGDGGGVGEEDLAGLRPFVAGDSPRRIAWKAMARSSTDDLVVKQFDGLSRGELLLEWAALPAALDGEARLSRLTAWVLQAEARGLRWSLRLPGRELAPDAGSVHRERCLEALALARI